MKVAKFKVVQAVSFIIFLTFIALAFSVDASDCNSNIKNLTVLGNVMRPAPVQIGNLK